MWSLSSACFVAIIVPLAMHGCEAARDKDESESGVIGGGDGEVRCPTVDEVVDKGSALGSLYGPLAASLKTCKVKYNHALVAAVRGSYWKGSYLYNAIVQEGHAARFKENGMDLILTKESGFWGTTFKICAWVEGGDGDPQELEVIREHEYKLSEQGKGKKFKVMCSGPQFKIMPDGVAGQMIGGEWPSKDPLTIAAGQGHDMPEAVWKLLKEKNAFPVYEKLAQALKTLNAQQGWLDGKGEEETKQVAEVVKSFENEFMNYGIRLYMNAFYSSCGGGKAKRAATFRWLEFVDPKIAGDYRPTWQGFSDVQEKHNFIAYDFYGQ